MYNIDMKYASAVKRKFSRAVAFAVLTGGIIIAVIATIFFYNNSVRDNQRVQMEKIQTIASMIDPNDVDELKVSDADLENPTYVNLLARLVHVVEENSDISYLYILKAFDNNIYFSVDSGSSDGQTWPGKVYEAISPKLWRAFNSGQPQFHGLDDGDNTDEWGTWITAYAPIKDADGNVLAVICMDVDRDLYFRNILIDASPPVLMMLIFVLIIFFYWFTTKRQIEQYDKEKQLLSVASHEVRSPMVSIKWVLENMLETSKNLSDADRATILAVYNNTAKVVSNIEGILSSTPSWSRKQHRQDDVYMKKMFQDIADTLSLVAKEHRAVIRIDDSVTDGLFVKGDEQNLHHAFYNVVNNALKYTYLDTEVVISYKRTEKYHQFRISDRGPGVRPEDRKKIFEGLYRTSEAKASQQPGTGLGLYFVKKIIDNHDGRIYVDPDYSEGTAFIVELPL